eukprot:gene28512-19465_t
MPGGGGGGMLTGKKGMKKANKAIEILAQMSKSLGVPV